MKYVLEMSMGQGMPAMKSTVYVKGGMERRDMDMMGMGQTSTITQCDKKQTITISSRCNAYMTSGLDESGAPAGPPAGGRGGPVRQGGTVTLNNNIRVTDEKQTLLGHPARHVIMKMTTDAPQGTCHPGHMEVESDMWVIDLPRGPECRMNAAGGEAPPIPAIGGCRDKYVMHNSGSGVAAMRGLPVKSTYTISMANGQKQTMSMNVTELSTEPLSDSLFQAPAGYKQASSPQEMYMCGGTAGAGPSTGMSSSMAEAMKNAQRQAAEARSKGEAAQAEAAASQGSRSGVPLIGIVFNDRSSHLNANTVTTELAEKIRQHEPFEAVQIEAKDPAAIQKEAVEKKCTFLLYAEVPEAKTSSVAKIGGLLGRAARIGSGNLQPTQTIRLDYRLTWVDPADQQVAKDTLNQSEQAPSIEPVAANLMDKTAERATTDAARALRERKK